MNFQILDKNGNVTDGSLQKASFFLKKTIYNNL